MPKRRNATLKLQDFDLFGDPIEAEPKPAPSGQMIPLDFETHAVRMMVRDGQPWWIAADVCRVLELSGDPGQHTRRLEEDEKGLIQIQTLGGQQSLLAVNESGLFELIFRSDKPEARRFRRWVTHEVLPTIRKTGTYSVAPSRVRTVARRLKVDMKTAQARVEQIDINKKTAGWLAECDAKPAEYAGWHNAAHKGMFGRTAAELRQVLGLSKGATPLDRMGMLPLLINSHAKALAMVKAKADNLSATDAADVCERTAREMAGADLRRIGPDFQFDVIEHDRRGLVIDVNRRALPA